MKKLILSMAAVAALASCSNDESNAPEVLPGDVPIIVNAGLATSVETKAPVEGSTFKANTENAFNLMACESDPTSGDWETDAYFENLPVDCNAEGEFHTGKFYPGGGATLYFCAYAPGGSTYTSSNSVVTFNITGQEDIMYAGKVQGSAAAQPTLNFEHKLMQVKFKAKLDDAIQDQQAELTNIKINNVKTTYSLNLGTGELTETGDAGSLNLVVSSQSLTNSEVNVPGSLMFYPQTGFTITATAGGQEYTTKSPVTIASPEAGKIYTITLTFNGTEIIPTVTITPWTSGGDDIQVDVER